MGKDGRSSQQIDFPRWAVVFLCLLALAITLRQNDRLPLWWDEGFSIYFAQFPPGKLIAATAADVHPPTYYLFLASWLQAVGTSPFAARGLSAVVNLLTLPLLFVLGKKLNGATTGVTAALLASLSPFLFHHARDARMYSLGITLAAAALLAFTQLLSGQKKRRWRLLLAGSIVAGLYNQYAFALLAAGMGLAVLWGWGQKRLAIRPWLLTAVLISLGFLPWVWFAWPQIQGLQANRVGNAASLQIAWGQIPLIWRQLVAGYTPAAGWLSGLTVVLFSGMAVWGAAALSRRHTFFPILALPVVAASIVLAITIQYDIPGVTNARAARLAFPAIPFLIMAAAAGLASFFRHQWWGWGMAGMTAALLAANIFAACRQPINLAEDYRPLIAQIQEYHQPGDVILAAYDWQDGYFASYAPDLAQDVARNEYANYDPSPLLARIFSRTDRVWVVNYQVDALDPAEPTGQWMSQHAGLAFADWFGQSQVALFVKPDSTAIHSISFEFMPGVKGKAMLPQTAVALGEVLQLTLVWETAVPLDRRYQTFLHLGRPDQPPIAQDDREPQNGVTPMDAWPVGTAVTDYRAILLPNDAPPGVYFLYLGLYDPATGDRLPVIEPTGCDQPDRACLGEIEIIPGG